MKLFVFTDIHAQPRFMKAVAQRVKKAKPDAVICAGDISIFEHGFVKAMQWLSKLHSKTFFLHGNHETLEHSKFLCEKFGVTFLHKKTVELNSICLAGWGGGGFSLVEPDLERFLARTKLPSRTVLVTHAPPFGTKLDYLGKHWGHVGNKSLTRFLKKNKNIMLAVSGHIHETFEKTDVVGKTIVVNPGPLGMLIEV